MLPSAWLFQVFSFPQTSPPKPSITPLLSHTCYMPCPYLSSRFDHLNNIGQAVQIIKQYRSLSSSLFSFLHSPVTASLLGPNILLNTLFSNTILHSTLNVSDQVSHAFTTGKIIVLYILIFKFLDSSL